ncbi:Smr/MutS family protein [Desulfococcus sp.]|uniref:Smr/MutS family protein n=1 Tax=Desulfococcus sp. TaxID=2025834 RepID=UPI003593574E
MFSILKRLFRRRRPEDPRSAPHEEAPVRPEKVEVRPVPPAEEADALCEPDVPPLGGAPEPGPAPGRQPGKPPENRPKGRSLPSSRNRHGIPVFKRDADIPALFDIRREVKPDEAGDPPRVPPKAAPSLRKGRRMRNRHGIPLFGENTDFSIHFKEAPPKAPEARAGGGKGGEGGKMDGARPELRSDDFRDLLESSLADKTTEFLLREKNGDSAARICLTPEQAIRGYPPPQEELDLHGKTSQEAIDGTRAFVERSRYRGKRTLLIIVGKGLHSEGKAILPDVVEAELVRLRQEGKVLTHRWERGAKRKSGAIVAYLSPM